MIDRGRTLLSNGSLVIGYFRFGTERPTGSVFGGGSKDNKVDSVDDICKHIDFNSKLPCPSGSGRTSNCARSFRLCMFD